MVGPTQDNKPTPQTPIDPRAELDKVGEAIKIDPGAAQQEISRGCAEPSCWDAATPSNAPAPQGKPEVARGCAEPSCWDKATPS
jgi:hypothetical protein